MGIASVIPGMKPGRPYRNGLVGVTYLLVLAPIVSAVGVAYRPFRGC